MQRVVALVSVLWSGVLFAQAKDVTELPADCGALQLTGTFTNLDYDGKAGMTGAEIRIVVTESGYQASLQFAEGKIGDLHVGDAEFSVDTRYWPLGVPLPKREPDTETVQITVTSGAYAGTFAGQVTKNALAGVYTLASGRKLSLNLPRRKGRWE